MLFVSYPLYYSFLFLIFFFFNDPATTEIYTLSLHDALPISIDDAAERLFYVGKIGNRAADDDVLDPRQGTHLIRDRKSTRLNSSHVSISYAVFCLKKKKKITNTTPKQSIGGHFKPTQCTN